MSAMDNLFDVNILTTNEIRDLFDKHNTCKVSWLCDDILFKINDELYLGWDDSAAGQSPELLGLCNVHTNQFVSFPPFEAGAIMAQLLTVERWVQEHNETGHSGNCDLSQMFQGMGVKIAIDFDSELITLSDADADTEENRYSRLSFDCSLSKAIAFSILSCVRHIDNTVSQGR